ncbi:hypothetical protein JCM31826_01080 [Thermaurantimonas aggregans]|uniref:Uncharacterized protein n=1 Tax=Thermaurantimonas aggregans TaxID=2173829 RepID=A0A401XHY5_9FLAO|nr:hypothetical protein [Thermaurantimonas aggregans]MCX8149185.1 hypothetical protein [Thermaurantimonas aggregans]GCD76626.1 hypothetical protein JCM31826_01080 [Thermaurantimonas aggregans]
MITYSNQRIIGKRWNQNLKLIVPEYCQKCVNPNDKRFRYVVHSNGDKKAQQRFIKSNGFSKNNVFYYRVKSDFDILFTLPLDDDPLHHFFMNRIIEIYREYIWTLGKNFFENMKR